jgi:hypothetical protein
MLTFCGLDTVGDKLNFGYYGIPFAHSDRPSVNDTIIKAINVFVAQAINTGAYLAAAANYFPDPPSREECQFVYNEVVASTKNSPVLDIYDMAGLYVVQAAGTVLSLIVFGIRHVRGRMRAREARAATAAVEECEAEPEEGGGLKQLTSHGFTATRRFVHASGEVTAVTLGDNGHHEPGAAPAQAPRKRDATAKTSSFVDKEIDGSAWGERTGMERRLTNMLQELNLRVDELRASVAVNAAPPPMKR